MAAAGVLGDEALAPEETAEVPILMYHSIADEGPAELAPYRIAPAAFAAQLEYLKDHGYRSISLKEWGEAISERRRLPGRPIVISFDDGYRNFLDNAWPLLERTGFTATMFVVTDKVGHVADWDSIAGEKLPLMGWDDLRYLHARGVELGSHTAGHPSLPALSDEQIIAEGTRSRDRLAEKLGIEAGCLAYPYGHTDSRVRQAVRQAGYPLGVRTWGGVSTVLHEPLNLPRIEIFPDDDLTAFAGKIATIRPRLTRAARVDNEKPQSAAARLATRHQLDSMPMHPDYAQRLAAQLDALIGEFASLHSQILTGGAPAQSLQTRLVQLFRQPVTGRIVQDLTPYQTLPTGASVGFENGGLVMLTVEPKLDHSVSPESCANTLEFGVRGRTRWLSLEIPCDWADISSARRYQLGIYATVNRDVSGRAFLRLPGKDGKPIDVVFRQFDLMEGRRNINAAGELSLPDLLLVDTEKQPKFCIDMQTEGLDDFSLKLNYLTIYFA